MKFVIQRVLESKVTIDGETVGSIGRGLMVLIGIGRDDTKETADKFVRKMIGLRIFEDEEGKTNLALKDVDGQMLLISQFTLYADCCRGNRPGFTDAAPPAEAEVLYDYIVDACRREVSVVQTGAFGADMKVSLVNDGPFTIVLDESILKKGRQ